MAEDRLTRAVAAIDAANAEDPNRLSVEGLEGPKEIVHAELMTRWVTTLDPQAGEAQRLAARAHHLRRWTVPRADYPTGRTGYLRWRSTLRKQHAAEVETILAAAGYEPEVVERVQQIILKQGLRADPPDPQVQVHEDALCLVFLQTQLDSLAAQLGDDHTVEVLVKSLQKMSDAGHRAAGALSLSDHGRSLVEQAVARV